jgi:hypothetical protein
MSLRALILVFSDEQARIVTDFHKADASAEFDRNRILFQSLGGKTVSWRTKSGMNFTDFRSFDSG